MLPLDLRSTLAVTVDHLITATNIMPTPPVVLSSISGMLDWLEARMPCAEVVVLVDGAVMDRHGLPVTAVPSWTGLDDTRADGWRVTDLAAWTSYTRETRHAIHVGHLPWLDVERSPLIADGISPAGRLIAPPGWDAARYQAVAGRFDVFHGLTGVPYRGTPGMAGHAGLRHQERTDSRRVGVRAIAWRPDLMPRAQEVPTRVTRDGLERDYTKTWTPGTLPLDGDTPPVILDANKQYLAAAAAADVARGPLEHREHRGGLTGDGRDRKMAGYWKVELSTWGDLRIPDPAGYPHAGHKLGAPRWVTSPTLDLLDELTARGEYGGYMIVESYTAPGSRVLRRWAETIRDAIRAVEDTQDQTGFPPDVVLSRALKMTYAESIGLFGHAGGRIFRSDWQSTIIGRARSIFWRKMWTAGQTEGLWPLALNVDAVTYPRIPTAFTVDPRQLGAFKVAG